MAHSYRRSRKSGSLYLTIFINIEFKVSLKVVSGQRPVGDNDHYHRESGPQRQRGGPLGRLEPS